MKYPLGTLLLALLPALTHASDANRTDDEFLSTCKAEVHQRVVNSIFPNMGWKSSQSMPNELAGRLEKLMSPMINLCICQKKTHHMPIGAQLKAKKNDKYMATNTNESSCRLPDEDATRRIINRLILFARPEQAHVAIPRKPFTVRMPGNGEPSLFASLQPPPDFFPLVVFLQSGTGMACPAGELCIDDGNLISVFPDELSEKQKKAGGMELARSLEQTTHKLGADFQIVFSGRNYTNFHFDKSSRQYVYEVVTIDGIPIEKSGFKKIWLIQFNEEPNINPRSSDLRMAATKIIELEFIDEDMPHH